MTMETNAPRRRKRFQKLLPTLLFCMAAFTALVLVGVARWQTDISTLSTPSPRPPRPADNPILVREPMSFDPKLSPPDTLPDLSKVDRHLIEPTGLVKPRYCLLVFGPQAETRVWIVEDGEKIYVDRNANGDLCEAGEAFTPSERPDPHGINYRQWTYQLGDLSPSGRSEKHTRLKLVRYRQADEPMNSVLSVWVGGSRLQWTGWGPLFTESRDTAPIVHFGGPVLVKPLRSCTTFRRGEDRHDLHFCLGTPGLGSHSFAYLGYETVPASIHPVVEIAWPREDGVFKECFALTHCC